MAVSDMLLTACMPLLGPTLFLTRVLGRSRLVSFANIGQLISRIAAGKYEWQCPACRLGSLPGPTDLNDDAGSGPMSPEDVMDPHALTVPCLKMIPSKALGS